MISEDFLTRWNAITAGKGRESKEKKDNFEPFHSFLIEVFLKEVLGLFAKPFKLRRDCM